MFDWLRRLREANRRAAEDEARLTKGTGQGEPMAEINPLGELVRLAGESQPDDPGPRPSARRARPRCR